MHLPLAKNRHGVFAFCSLLIPCDDEPVPESDAAAECWPLVFLLACPSSYLDFSSLDQVRCAQSHWSPFLQEALLNMKQGRCFFSAAVSFFCWLLLPSPDLLPPDLLPPDLFPNLELPFLSDALPPRPPPPPLFLSFDFLAGRSWLYWQFAPFLHFPFW